MKRHLLVATTFIAAAVASSAGSSDELQVSKLRYAHATLAAVFVCPGAVAPNDCDARTALQSIASPPWGEDVGCGVGSQAVLAGSGLRLVQGQYVKVVCAHDTAQAD